MKRLVKLRNLLPLRPALTICTVTSCVLCAGCSLGPPDEQPEITGVITRGRGVTVHRLGCTNLNDPQFEDRKIEVTWDASSDQTFLVKLIVIAADRKNLLAEVGQVMSSEGTNIKSGEFSSEDEQARATFLVEVHNLKTLQKILKSISQIPGVQKVERFQLSRYELEKGEE